MLDRNFAGATGQTLAGLNHHYSRLATKPCRYFLRALENMAEHHREIVHRPVLFLQDANYYNSIVKDQ